MANVRAAGQSLIGCWCDVDFVKKVDAARKVLGLSRSQFARDSIAEKLRSLKIHVGVSEYATPDRTGKGGPRKIVNLALNETAGELAKSGREKQITSYTAEARQVNSTKGVKGAARKVDRLHRPGSGS